MISCIAANAWAGKEYVLNPSDPAAYYAAVMNAGKGDAFVFPDGKRFEIQGYLGQGNTTRVFDLGDGKVLRVQKAAELINTQTGQKFEFGHYNRAYAAQHAELEKAGVIVPKMYEHSPTGHYIVVERVDGRRTMQDFIDLYKMGKMTDESFARYIEALKVFAASTAKLTYIGDFKPNQLVWDNGRFVLIDWTNGAFVASAVRNETVFNSPYLTEERGYRAHERWDQLPEKYRQKLVDAVHERRTQIALAPPLPHETPDGVGVAGAGDATGQMAPANAACPTGLMGALPHLPPPPPLPKN